MPAAEEFCFVILFGSYFSILLEFLKSLISGKPLLPSEAVHSAGITLLVIVGIWAVLLIIRITVRGANNRRIERIVNEQGVTPEVIALLAARVRRSRDRSVKAHARLALASCLSEGGCYDRCFEELREIDLAYLTGRAAEEYFNIYVYTNLMIGDVRAALSIYEGADVYFERALSRRSPAAVMHTLGVLSMAKGDLTSAETILLSARSMAADSAAMCDCDMFLSLCYMELGKPQLAVGAARTAAAEAVSLNQKRSVEGLRRRLEQRYAPHTPAQRKEDNNEIPAYCTDLDGAAH